MVNDIPPVPRRTKLVPVVDRCSWGTNKPADSDRAVVAISTTFPIESWRVFAETGEQKGGQAAGNSGTSHGQPRVTARRSQQCKRCRDAPDARTDGRGGQ